MKLSYLLLFNLLISLSSLGQSSATPDLPGDTSARQYKKIMIVPFESEMYLCGIQSKLASTSKMTHSQIVRYFRYGVANELQNKFLYMYNTISLIHFNDTTQDLLRTYAGVRYKFEPYQEEVTAAEANAPKKKKKVLLKRKKESKIKNGQLVSRKEVQPKFASLQIKDKTVIPFLNQKYQSDLYVFITELDIENDISDQVALANNKYVRFLRAHYAIVNDEGKFISKGVVKTTFPNTVNDVKTIKTVYFPKLAAQLAKKLPQPPVEQPKAIDPLEKIQVDPKKKVNKEAKTGTGL